MTFSAVTAQFGRDLVSVLPLDIVCNGSETELNMCANNTNHNFYECKKVAGVICEGSKQENPSIMLTRIYLHTAHCNNFTSSLCGECSGPYDCPIHDICFCSPTCFNTTGHCCPDVENYLECLGELDEKMVAIIILLWTQIMMGVKLESYV